MILYHFTTERFGLEAIKNSRLKIARIQELNDSFEFLGLALGRDDRLRFKRFKAEMDKKYGLICMSAGWKNPLLWSHYAEKHKGLCLGFDVADNDSFMRVTYRDERPTLQDFGCKDLHYLNEQHMRQLLSMKFSAWSYETEYRAFCDLEEIDPASGHYFIDFSESLKLAQVIVGHRSGMTRSQLASALGGRAGVVDTFKARPGFQRFEVVENQRAGAWE